MRRTLLLLGLLGLGIFLLVNPVTGIFSTPPQDPTTTAVAASTLPTTTTQAPPDGTDATTTPPPPTTTATTVAPVELVVDGPRVWSEWGYFQVEIVVVGGVMTDVELISQPSDRKSVRINDSAVPRYVEQALELQSADLDLVSGATFTWRYFRESLAGAMEAAGLAPAIPA